jgi:UDP-GlcNAc:undecaprenyl-phosphate/decaprenyl-phosphate GlcNAc-1-phosphate transferase
MVVFAAAFLCAAACAAVLTPMSATVARHFGIVDVPGGRKAHSGAIPRLGGTSVVLSVTLAFCGVVIAAGLVTEAPTVDGGTLLPLMTGAAVVFATGLWDDVRRLTPGQKLLGEMIGALVVIAAGVVIARVTVLGTTYELGAMAPIVTLAWIVGVTNAFNLIDGLDGLAGGLILIAAATCAIVLVGRGHVPEALLLTALAGAALGFLPWNLPPARVFMGDAGALFSGFLLATTAITGWQKGTTVLAVAVPVLMFALPLLDMVAAIGRRARASQRSGARAAADRIRALGGILRGDRSHIHHRLLDLGLSPRTVLLLLWALSVACSLLALASADFQ